MSLDDLYRRVLLDYARSSRNRGQVKNETATMELSNPSCGDRVRLSLDLREGRIQEAKFTGEGCSISMASASMMTEAVQGLTLQEATDLWQTFSRWLQGGDIDPASFPCEEIEALSGVKKFPARIKCAMLGWDALRRSVLGVQTTSKGV
ncbi:Fe-S cluster assembly sulfur transfer protein SufU [Pasteuria penetrans]|uniref:Fe-S cluster assembly sulfur transfer protein SufU n=1 Tax=Pasteuria penetrans TaxID=86005 RepID=UPI000FA4C03A|nr:SUF system NifU family Fe-S cluster assembly protein [Pasteuria penetrans]